MFENYPTKVKIVEVGARDGLQNEKSQISTDDKLSYILKLIDSGIKSLEVTSFVSPKAIPQMADSKELFSKLKNKIYINDFELPCLVPNIKGYENAKELGVNEIALFSATSSQFTKKNINATVEESFKRMNDISLEAKKDGIKIRGYISTVFGCPYAGEMKVKDLLHVVELFSKYDLYELSIGDTIGVATPKQVDEFLTELVKIYPKEKLAMHFHDTRGMALSNVLVALNHGISIFDSSSGGLGGCPYAKGATGNLATEDLVYLLNSFNIDHGLGIKNLSAASEFILNTVGKETSSKYLKAYLNTGK
jgi:hydroxymethylglutaryl-CoA lyase